MRPRHIAESDLALFISGDVSLWKYVKVSLHTTGCETCRARIEAYRLSRQRLKQAAAEMPAGSGWDRLAAEMTANIRVGLAAGECVAPRRGKMASFGWKRAAGWKTAPGGKPVAMWAGAAAGVVLLLSAAWWINLPSSDANSLARVARALFQGRLPTGAPGSSVRGRSLPPEGEWGPVVEASSAGVELRENGVAVSIPQAASRPVAITVSAPGSASARYVDADTGQITIAGVYAQ